MTENETMELQELISLNKEGLIPGPSELEEDFLRRIFAIKKKYFEQLDAVPLHDWHWASERLRILFDFSPRWCAAILSRKGLTPWQAAATWVDVNRFYMIQINPARWVQRLIDRDELLAHEAVHAARAAFEEPAYEELFAYLTSNRKWRQVLGAFFRRPGEALALLGVISCGSLLQLAEVMWDLPEMSSLCFFAGAGMICFWSLRLLKVRLRLKRASERLMPFLREPKDLLALLFRLTDAEINALAKGEKMMGNDLRWRLLKAAYLRENGAVT